MATNNNDQELYKKKRHQAYMICRIVAENTGFVSDQVKPNSKFEDLGADIQDVLKIISYIEAYTNNSFEENAEELASSITYVDDLIEKALGVSFFDINLLENEDDEYSEAEMDVEAGEERFESFIESYRNGEYDKYDIYKLTGMFQNEAESCKDEGVAAKYLCVSAVVRMQYFCTEWINFNFKNYTDEENSLALAGFCLSDALKAIKKCLVIESHNTEYNLVFSILNTLADYWIDHKPLSNVVIYEDFDEMFETSDEDDIFDREDLLNLYSRAYDRLAEMFSCQLKQEKEYLDCYNELLEDYGEVGPRERKRLERDRKRLGIAEERVQELEAKASSISLTKEEQQYQHEYREMLMDYRGKLGPIERKRLKRFRSRLGIGCIRAFEIELL